MYMPTTKPQLISEHIELMLLKRSISENHGKGVGISGLGFRSISDDHRKGVGISGLGFRSISDDHRKGVGISGLEFRSISENHRKGISGDSFLVTGEKVSLNPKPSTFPREIAYQGRAD
jgi:hypothetical protein